MKVKLTIAGLFSALLINAASAEGPDVQGEVSTRYTTDYHRRGAELSAEAIQAQVGFNVGLGSVDVFGDFFTNQSTGGSDINTDELTIGLGTGLFDDNINAYLGVYNTDSDGSESTLEAFAAISGNYLLSPTISFYRDTDDNLNTFEGSLSHTFDLSVVDLKLTGNAGTTDVSTSTDYTYTGARATVSKDINDSVNLYTDLAITDTDTRDNETVWGMGLSVRF